MFGDVYLGWCCVPISTTVKYRITCLFEGALVFVGLLSACLYTVHVRYRVCGSWLGRMSRKEGLL